MFTLIAPVILACALMGQSNLMQNGATQANLISDSELITYHGTAQSVSKALEGIAKVSSGKIKIHVSDSLKNEVILVDVTKVPLNILLQKIAKVEFGKWTFEGNLAFLNENSVAENAQDNATYNSWSKNLLKKLNSTAPKDLRAKMNDEDDASSDNDDQQPDTNALLKLLGTKVIVSFPKGERIVFSTNPNSMQKPFPQGCLPYLMRLSKLTKREALNNSILSGNHPNQSEPSSLSETKSQIAKIDLVLSNPDQDEGIGWVDPYLRTSATLIDFDASGRIIGGNSLSIPIYSGLSPIPNPFPLMEANEGDTDFQSVRSVRSRPIELEGSAKEMYAALHGPSRSNGKEIVGHRAKMLKYVLDPVSYEPLNVCGAFISNTAKAFKMNLVASLPDSLFSSVAVPVGRQTQSANSEMLDLQEIPQIQVQRDDNWMIISPSLPTVSHENRIDREFLKSADVALNTSKTLDINDLAKIAVSIKGRLGILARDYFIDSNPSFVTMFHLTNWHLVQFYGLLLPELRNTLNSGGTIRFSELTGESKSVAFSLVFGANSHLFMDSSPSKSKSNNPLDPYSDTSAITGGPKLNSAKYYLSEPTEVAPNGIAASAPITGLYSNTNIYHLLANQDSDPIWARNIKNMPCTPSMVAAFIAEKNDPKYQIVGISQGTRSILTIKLYIAPSIFAGGIIHDDYFPPNAKDYTLDNLPKEVQDAVKEAENSANQNVEVSTGGPTGP